MKRKVSIIALLIITIIAITGCGNSSSNERIESDRYTYNKTEPLYKVVHYHGNVESFDGVLVDKNGNVVDENKYINLEKSGDGSTYYVYGGDDKTKILYEIEEEQTVEITTVNARGNFTQNMTPSLYGDSLVYTCTSNSDESLKELYIYFADENKSYLVDENVYINEPLISYTISPDGRTLVYIKDYDKGTGVGNIYISKNGEAGKLIYENALPLAVSNDGQEIYYKTANNELYKNDTLLSNQPSFKRYNVQMTFNESYTEFMLLDSDYESYYYRDGELIKLEMSAQIQTPSDILTYAYNYGYAQVSVIGIDTFDKSVYMTEDGIFYMDNSGTAFHQMLEKPYEITLSRDGKKMLATYAGSEFYLFEDVEKYDDYSYCDLNTDDNVLTSCIAMVTNDDLSNIYCIYDTDLIGMIADNVEGKITENGLYKIDVKGGKAKRIDDADGRAIYSEKHNRLYYTVDNSLYSVSSNDIKSLSLGNVEGLYYWGEDIMAYCDKDGYLEDYKLITGKDKFENFIKEDK